MYFIQLRMYYECTIPFLPISCAHRICLSLQASVMEPMWYQLVILKVQIGIPYLVKAISYCQKLLSCYMYNSHSET